MYRIMACDLDGTLLRDDKTISKETEEALIELTDRGVIFLPSTGRTHRELPAAIKDLPFIHYALCCNGGSVYNYIENRYIYEDAIPYELALEVLEYVKTLPVYETVVVNGERFAKGDENDEICEYIRNVAVKDILVNFKGAHDVKKAYEETHMDAQKLLLYLGEGADRIEVMNDLSSRFPQLAISSSGPVFIEVNIKGVDKGKALERFCELMAIPVEETVAFGDAENDISMLKTAGMAVVMENATPETKKYADMICASNNDDGVRKAIEELWK
ncbi:MAG: HAD family phosphatase [Erysipelotrichaceae bacterium]|nr:HAD family phosphatase [Erysipelotrichaceae bacterium]